MTDELREGKAHQIKRKYQQYGAKGDKGDGKHDVIGLELAVTVPAGGQKGNAGKNRDKGPRLVKIYRDNMHGIQEKKQPRLKEQRGIKQER